MDTQTTAAALALVWFGMVVAISFIEAPLKFRAPGITTELGLGIGRLVFAALNGVEGLLALLIFAVLVSDGVGGGGWWLLGAVVVLIVQLAAVRPALRQRTRAVLGGGGTGARSRAHWWYVGLEVVKAACLIIGGVQLLAA
ncbi:hypothetical protein [Serinibacter salmoneus]|uniref:DUF4149 domain-containing protein n=1 Tax=Serinibacter salmoneus TaxID=556530 RepID=A0A2A9D3H6_9MICO|nr:hypothetical protein [Serinibacter salmoneus]PFG21214.1 hypothetical protein ATL40_2837 [Serinibacter salmoneus]